ncbi:ATP-binding cassette domain-containing protein [Paenibacillus sp. SYP-B3998]|uniref:Carnitine transport ATP-binding protein OpuCA n=1 Tax=Paenibacillus sp. SYP-B3998 TaxID=2678564 RepID=A0A6G3ZZY6_9BACL|nr:ATP-binding cassette domain-containing protein [Paenibacillus sp. SYP-B3998]NEW06967.1 ATP-binding cassette domain-containing protein [Paenibacillus sp. SYP-B3998]
MTEHDITIQGITKSFGRFHALKRIDAHIKQGEFVCLLGPSGCGKTTLLRIIAGLEAPDSGLILAGGKDITSLPPAKRNIGVVFQSYALFPNLTASENIAYGLTGKGMSRQDIRCKAEEMLEMVGLAQVRDRYPAQLSGGQQQRVALARAIALSPQFLLLDEPLSALDAKVRHRLRQQICELQARLGITTVMVTHDQEEALTMADRIIVMNHAEVIQIGTPEDIYNRPATPFVADFIGTMNFIKKQSGSGLGNERIWAIRPEHVKLAASHEEDSIPALLTYIEFRGSFYRLTVETLPGHSDVAEGQSVHMDVQVEAYVLRQMALGDRIAILLPQARLISFEGAGESQTIPLTSEE